MYWRNMQNRQKMEYLEVLKEAIKKEDFGKTYLLLDKIKNEENSMDYFEVVLCQ